MMRMWLISDDAVRLQAAGGVDGSDVRKLAALPSCSCWTTLTHNMSAYCRWQSGRNSPEASAVVLLSFFLEVLLIPNHWCSIGASGQFLSHLQAQELEVDDLLHCLAIYVQWGVVVLYRYHLLDVQCQTVTVTPYCQFLYFTPIRRLIIVWDEAEHCGIVCKLYDVVRSIGGELIWKQLVKCIFIYLWLTVGEEMMLLSSTITELYKTEPCILH